MSTSTYAKIGFNFFGEGNVGDDLMLQGFLEIWPMEKPLFGIADQPRNSYLKRRFPEISWLLPGEVQPDYDLWLGVGDTPFQVLSGEYFLKFLENEFAGLPSNCRVWFLGVGVETECLLQKPRFQKIVDRLELISTRDRQSYEFLHSEFSVSHTIVHETADLAHLALAKLFANDRVVTDPIYDLGVNLYQEKKNLWDDWKLYLQVSKSMETSRSIFISNENRYLKNSELRSHQQFSFVLQSLLKKPCPQVYSPSYFTKNISTFGEVFTTLQRLASSRYHCLLMGAWAGCECLGLKRSSKVLALGQLLGLECVSVPELTNYLKHGTFTAFRKVDPALLSALEEKAGENSDLLSGL